MTIKLAKIIDPKFSVAYRRLIDAKMPMQTAFKLKKIAAKINNEQIQYENMRKDLLQQFGDKKEDGTLATDNQGIVKMSDNNGREFVAKHQELLSAEVNVGFIKVQELGNNITITPGDLLALEDIIQE